MPAGRLHVCAGCLLKSFYCSIAFESLFCLCICCAGDAGSFDQEWKQRTRHPLNTLRDRQRSTLRALGDTGTFGAFGTFGVRS